MNRLFFLCLTLAIAHGAAGQETPKSPLATQIDALLDSAWATARSQPQQSLERLKTIEALYPDEGERYKEDVVLYYYGVFYKNLGRFDRSEAYFDRYEAYHQERDNTWKQAAVNMAKANLFSDQGNYPKSMAAATRSLSLYESINDTNGIISAGSKLGYLLSETGRYDEAIAYHEKSLAWARASGNLSEEQFSYTNLGLTHEKKRDYPAALDFYRRAYDIGEGLESDYDKVLNRYNMANILSLAGRGEAAIPFAEACAALADSIDIPALSGASRRLLADILLDKGQTQSGIELLRRLLDTAAYPLGLRDQTEVHGLLVKGYQLQGDYKRAFESLETLKTLNDSLVGLESRNRLNELSTVYETEKKEQQIALLDLEKESALTVIRQKNRTITLGALGLLLVTGLSVFLYVLYRRYRQQQQQLSKALGEKEFLIKEIHHRVKNNLQVISSLLQLQSRYVEEPTALAALNEGESRVRSMSIIHHHLYTEDNLSQVQVPRYVANLSENLQSSYNIRGKHIPIHQDIADISLDVAVMIPLGLILNELITNAFKYAFEGRESGNIWVRIATEAEGLTVMVKDDGVGIDPTAQKGFGTRLINTFLRKLNAEAETKTAGGTEVLIRIKDYQKNALLSQSA
jgi:two-component system, sensor histidine kinase PdtaS